MTKIMDIRSRCMAILFAVSMLVLSTLTVWPADALSGNYTWQQLTGISGGDQQMWQPLAMSDNGARMALGVYGGSIYTSSNFGMSWNTTTRDWYSIDSNSDGTKLVAGVLSGYLYISTNSGLTWTERTAAGSHWWTSVAISADGTKLAAIGDDIIYTSSDSGVTWTEHPTPFFRHWTSLAMSANGVKLLVVDPVTDALATSTDSGLTWTEQNVPGGSDFSAVAISADGNKMITGTYYGYIYTSSDSGVTWVPQTGAGSRYWQSIAASKDASQVVAVDYAGPQWEGGSVYVSSDSGVTWTEQTTLGTNFWQSVTMNASGSRIAVAVPDGPVYIGTIASHIDTENIDLSALGSSEDAAVSDAAVSISSSACPAIDTPSISILDPNGVTAPEAGIRIVGGIGFSILCATPGGSSDASIELGTYYADLSKIRIYKKAGSSSSLQDITDDIHLSNRVVSGGVSATTISYTLIDGSDYDEDGLINGAIVDPLYIGVASTGQSINTVATGTLADTGDDAYLWSYGGTILLILAILVYKFWH